ncbi:MAG: DUF2239 family protein [Gemmatimonadaceae bacterium]
MSIHRNELVRDDKDGATPTFTAFDGERRIAHGTLADVALAVKRAEERGASGTVLVFDDATGRVTDVWTEGTDEAVSRRYAERPAAEAPAEGDAARRRGRPRLGVVAREVTLLPRHWEWLAAQPGGASVALRKLVEEARRANAGQDETRRRREAAYRFATALAGDLPGYEEAMRALFAGDRERFEEQSASWPADVREHTLALAFPRAG